MSISLRTLTGFLLLLVLNAAQAALTDLASAPINTLLAAQVKPNIFFILDDSGSMQWSYLDDTVAIYNYENKVGYRSSLCNKIYYNPQVVYAPPVNADGTEYPAQDFNRALYDGYQTNAARVNLANEFMAWRTNETILPTPESTSVTRYTSDCFKNNGNCILPTGSEVPNRPEAAYYFLYKGTQRDKLGTNLPEDQCKDVHFDLSNTGSFNWTKVVVSNSSGPRGADERQNFANWFSYYRTRILTMKTSVGRAFRELDQHFRVGFSTIGYKDTDSANPAFLRIDDFDSDYKRLFYRKFYDIIPVASTPLRAALSKAGRLYAGQLLTGEDDPIQYSCQRNFTILSTDGVWNTSMEDASYGPYKIDGSTEVGNQDNMLERPMYDGSGSAGGSIAPARIARLIVSIIPSPSENKLTIVDKITINGEIVTLKRTGWIDKTNPAADANMLAMLIAREIALGGYRAVALGNVVHITAPASAGALVADIIVEVNNPLKISVTPFEDVPASERTRNTLADVAAYYYQTDLRTAALNNCRGVKNVCVNNVPVIGAEGNFQHMQTFTLGLGGKGTLTYQENYAEATSGDFHDIKNGLRNWPDPIFLDGPERQDDLWHAAVNGGGKYYNAQDPEVLGRVLNETLSTIRSNTSAAAASATSSQEPVNGDNSIFITRYRSVFWDGELEARAITLTDGSVSNSQIWSAQSLLDRRVTASTDTRKIYFSDGGNKGVLKNFAWSEMNATQRDYFASEKQVNYLRGQRQHENKEGNAERLFRRRDHVLGAFINAQPLYVARPAFSYADENYAAFRDEQQAERKGIVYAPANDGMLHAFNALTGEEEWAYIPPAVLPRLKLFAESAFKENFQYLLDGSPVAADICPSAPRTSCNKAQWRTVLIGGLSRGGRQYYALDITNPVSPVYLWKFDVQQDADLGFTYGKPIVTKRRNGRWVVLLTSGYNNVNPGNGKGYLFVLDAATGEVLEKIGTDIGTEDTPSGLAQINAWVDSVFDNTASRFYGGDLLGNIWRFDIDDIVPPAGKEAFLLAKAVNNNNPQPITVRPELSVIQAGGRPLAAISVATGKYLGLSDIADTSTQSIYTFNDELGSTGLDDLRSNSLMVKQTMTQSGDGKTRTVSQETVDWLFKSGWYIDLIADSSAAGERVTIDLEQQLGVLQVVTNLPASGACNIGGASWIYNFDYRNGRHLPLATGQVIGRKFSDGALIAGARTVKWQGRMLTILTKDDGSVLTDTAQMPADSAPAVKRVSWRELDDQ
jgi:type IV pilus assembly protein PilY1